MLVDAKLRKSLESSAVACLGVETSKRSQAAQYVEKELCKPKKCTQELNVDFIG